MKWHITSDWELGVETMKKGEICTLNCKPEYAYGKPGKPPTIPQNSSLVYEIELLRWEDEKVTLDSLVSKKIVKRGKGTDRVCDGGTVQVHLVGKIDKRIFDERDVQFIVGEDKNCSHYLILQCTHEMGIVLTLKYPV
ncbi:peptidyl-prolyl cis-trans isomerase FKBP5-like [Dendronephthya gigantea]|uniref:peptidyl-prolyl cis-trans isomerase FKBP5-like n=1 Tax=Dendronephthya gigantea TaxID=151771 RepID=UPI00106CFD84|nr:peptidyl-prolyl cis-trans isomerase FKBP5-like [Dendronephthya gigantea]